jgi:Tfp pilus assembly protein PilZ
MERYNGPERRQYVRYDCRYQTSFKRKGPEQSFDYSQTRNISKGGALLTTCESFKEGDVLEMIVRIPYTPAIVKVDGKIMWYKKIPNALVYELGVGFLGQDPVVNKFIEERLKNAV